MLEVFSGRFLPPRPQEGGRADPNPVPGWHGAVWRAWALPGDSLGVAQRGARAGLGGGHTAAARIPAWPVGVPAAVPARGAV